MENSSKWVVFAALAVNAIIAIIKFGAAFLSGSAALLSEGIHSVVDTANEGLLLYGLHRAKKPPDEDFPFGYGKEIYFWCFVVAFMLFMVGAVFSIFEGVQHIIHEETLGDVWIGYAVLGLALVFEASSWSFAVFNFSRNKGRRSYIQAVRRSKDPTVFVVLFEDSAAILGIVVAFFGLFLTQLTDNGIFDGAASILIGIILGVTAVLLGREVKGLLIGESANRPVVQGVRELALSYPQIRAVNEVLTMHVGPDFILVNLSVVFANDITAAQVADVSARLDKSIKQKYPRAQRVFIEAETAFLNRPAIEHTD